MSHGDKYQTIDPSTEKVIRTFPSISDDEVLAALAAAQECYTMHWRHSPIERRAEVVSKAAALLNEETEKHAQLITLEMGKLIDQARWEISVCVDILSYYATHAKEFLKPVEIEGGASTVITEPIGPILAIEPWNFPYYQLARVAAPQIMAGNVLLVKPAPSTPQCGLAFAELFARAGAPQGLYTNIFSSLSQTGMLIDDFRIRGVTLTGSERAGAAVAERAGKALKKVVLELGGSDPFLILKDASLEKTAQQSLASRMLCMGQACAASKRYIIVGKDRMDSFIENIMTQLKSFSTGEPTDSKTTIGPVASQASLDLLLSQINQAERNGARILAGGNRISRPGYYIEPTIITDISPQNPLFSQETFGPVFSVYAVDSDEEAIELANATSFGLSATVFGPSDEYAQEVARKLDCGMVFVNSGVNTSAELPFGGVKNSGFGRELGGEMGISEFVNKKLIRCPKA